MKGIFTLMFRYVFSAVECDSTDRCFPSASVITVFTEQAIITRPWSITQGRVDARLRWYQRVASMDWLVSAVTSALENLNFAALHCGKFSMKMKKTRRKTTTLYARKMLRKVHLTNRTRSRRTRNVGFFNIFPKPQTFS